MQFVFLKFWEHKFQEITVVLYVTCVFAHASIVHVCMSIAMGKFHL